MGHTIPTSFDALLQRRGRFLSFVKRSGQVESEWEDVLQDAFVKSLEHQHSLRDSDKVVAWFYRVLRNELVDRHRRAARHRRALEVLRHQTDVAEPPEHEAFHSRRSAEQLLGQLSEQHRQTLQELFSADGNLDILAAKAGITVNHAAVRACRARQALRSLWQGQEDGTSAA